MNRRESADLDRHITGNWGEDSVGNASIRRQHGGHQPNCHGRSDPQACICTFDHGEVEAVHNHGSEEGPGLGCVESNVAEPTLHEVFSLMESNGGGFASLLASAWFRADPVNKGRIESGWADYIEDYTGLVAAQRANA